MFVLKTKMRGAAIGLALAMTLAGATAGVATEAPAWKSKEGTIPVTVTLTDVQLAGPEGGPIYVSIQTRKDYQSMKGFGGILSDLTAGEMVATFKVDEPGEYSVSVWHDRDDDGRFSMDESFTVLDSWGASGTPPQNAAPTFDDVKIDVPNMGTHVSIQMLNPK